MKKSLSLLLAIAMVFSMFASVAFAADNNLTTEQKYQWFVDQGVLKGNPDGNPRLGDKLTRAEFATIAVAIAGLEPKTDTETFSDVKKGQWWHGAIEAAAAAGLVNGVGGGKFDPRSNVTLEQVIAVAVRILDLDPVEGANVPGASAWAAGYVQAALDAGLITAQANYKVAATRGQTIDIVYPTYQSLQLAVESATVIDAKTVEVKFTDGSVVKVTLDQALPANKEQEITVKHESGKEFKVKVTYVVTTATKVESVTATNLKQVVVKFDGEVDKATAEDASNYTITGGSPNANPAVESASLSADKTTVTLNVAYNTTYGAALHNQQEYKLDINNVKAGDKIISVDDYKFTPVDAELPKAVSATALGNSTIKVVFSEPVLPSTNINSFKIDGNVFGGTVNANGGNSVVVKFYSVLSEGAHKISVSGVSDYSGLKSLAQEFEVNVVADNTAPTIASVENATFEKVTLKFSEPIDPSSIAAGNVYWLQGGSKKTASSFTVVADDTIEFHFTSNPLQYATDVYVVGVKDYSGNTIASDSKIYVTPTLDQVRPEVTNVEYDAAAGKFTIKFSKAVDKTSAENPSNYVIKDQDGKEVSKYKQAVLDLTDNKKVYVTLGVKLSEGKTYTLTISGVSDTTVLKNVMLPYTKQITVSDSTAPTVSGVVYDSTLNRLFVTFNEAMALSGDGSVIDRAKYFYSKNNGGSWSKLPDSASLNIQSDLRTVIISVPKSDLDVATVTHIRVQLVKDTAGNYLNGLTADVPLAPAGAVSVTSAKATSTTTIELYASRALLASSFNLADFTVTAGGVTLNLVSGSIDGSTIKLTLADSNKLSENGTFGGNPVNVAIRANATTSTPDGVALSGGIVPGNVQDGIAATVKTINGSTNGSTVVLTFNENLGTSNANWATDLLVKDRNGNVLKPNTDYTVSASGNQLTITFTPAQTGVITVQIVNPRFITDSNGNIVAGSDELQVLNG